MTLLPPSPLLTPRGLLFGGWSCLSVVLVHAGREGRRQCGTLAGLLARQALAYPGAELVEHAA